MMYTLKYILFLICFSLIEIVAADQPIGGQKVLNKKISYDAYGNSTAVWEWFNGSNIIIQAASQSSAMPFSTPVDLSALGFSAYNPDVSSNASGQTWAAWEQSDGAHLIIKAAFLQPDGSWSCPRAVSSPSYNAFHPKIVCQPDGSATVTWQLDTLSKYLVQSVNISLTGPIGIPTPEASD